MEPGSPAEKSGLVGGILPIKIAGEEFLFGGDIITEITNAPLDSPEIFFKFLQKASIGDKVDLKILHENKLKTVSLTVKERPLLPWDLPMEDCHMAAP